jgi:hypothetical protein
MDVWFCEGRNHCREAQLRTAESCRLDVRALPSALADSCASPLTKTYMDVGNSEVMMRIGPAEIISRRCAFRVTTLITQ